MTRKQPIYNILRILYARSGNECAYPGCTHPLFNDENEYIANLCHIEAASEGGPRYNINQTDDERRSEKNLLFMCYRHHVESNKLSKQDMISIKTTHEKLFSEKQRSISSEMLKQIELEIEFFWNRQKNHTLEHPEFRADVDFAASITDLLRESRSYVSKLADYYYYLDSPHELFTDISKLFKNNNLDFSVINNLPYHENPFFRYNDIRNIAIPNFLTRLEISLIHLKIRILEEELKKSPEDEDIKRDLSISQEEFQNKYVNSYIS